MPVSQTQRVIYQIEVDGSKAVRTLGDINKNTDRLATGFERAARSASNVGRTLRNLFVGGALFAAARNITSSFTSLSDSALDLQARLSASAGGASQGVAVFEELFRISQRLGVPVEELGQSFQRLSIAIPTAPLSELTFGLETVAQALATTGASVQATNAVMLQLSQAFGAGALRGDEFKSVLENAPVLLRAWAQAAGQADKSLKDLRDAEFFTTQSFIENNAAIRENVEAITNLDKPASTVARSLTRIRNAFIGGFFRTGGQETPFTALTEQLDRIANVVGPATFVALQNVASVLDTVGSAVSGVATATTSLATSLAELRGSFTELRSDLKPVQGELGLLGFTLGVFIPSAIATIPKFVETLGDLLQIRFSQIVENLKKLWLLFGQFVAEVLASTINKVVDSVDFTLNGLARSFNRIRPTINEILGTGFGELPTVSFGRLEVPAGFEPALAGVNTRLDELTQQAEKVKAGLVEAFDAKLAEREADALRLVTQGLKVETTARGTLTETVNQETGSKKSLNAARREEEALRRESLRMMEEEARLIKQINEEQRDFTDSLQDEIRALDERLLILSAPEADRDRIADALEIEGRLRKLNTDILREENAQRQQSLIIRREELREAVPSILTRRDEIRQREAAEAGRDTGNVFSDAFEDATGGLKDALREVFRSGIDEAQDFADRLRDILTDTVDRILGTLIDTFVDDLTRGVTQGIRGLDLGGGGGGGIGGFFSSLFGGGGGGGLGALSPAGAAPGGGGFNFGSLALGAGLLGGAFFGGLFDSDRRSEDTSALALSPLPDVFSGGSPNITIVNNGSPLKVDSITQRSNGEYQMIVSDAVEATRSAYARETRRGFGGFAESLRNNTTADNAV